MLSEDFHVFMTADPDEVDASKITPNVTNLGILLNSGKRASNKSCVLFVDSAI